MHASVLINQLDRRVLNSKFLSKANEPWTQNTEGEGGMKEPSPVKRKSAQYRCPGASPWAAQGALPLRASWRTPAGSPAAFPQAGVRCASQGVLLVAGIRIDSLSDIFNTLRCLGPC